jgi:hypothetical protein
VHNIPAALSFICHSPGFSYRSIPEPYWEPTSCPPSLLLLPWCLPEPRSEGTLVVLVTDPLVHRPFCVFTQDKKADWGYKPKTTLLGSEPCNAFTIFRGDFVPISQTGCSVSGITYRPFSTWTYQNIHWRKYVPVRCICHKEYDTVLLGMMLTRSFIFLCAKHTKWTYIGEGHLQRYR